MNKILRAKSKFKKSPVELKFFKIWEGANE